MTKLTRYRCRNEWEDCETVWYEPAGQRPPLVCPQCDSVYLDDAETVEAVFEAEPSV